MFLSAPCRCPRRNVAAVTAALAIPFAASAVLLPFRISGSNTYVALLPITPAPAEPMAHAGGVAAMR